FTASINRVACDILASYPMPGIIVATFGSKALQLLCAGELIWIRSRRPSGELGLATAFISAHRKLTPPPRHPEHPTASVQTSQGPKSMLPRELRCSPAGPDSC